MVGLRRSPTRNGNEKIKRVIPAVINSNIFVGFSNSGSPFLRCLPFTTSGEAFLKSYAQPIRAKKSMKAVAGLNTSKGPNSLAE